MPVLEHKSYSPVSHNTDISHKKVVFSCHCADTKWAQRDWRDVDRRACLLMDRSAKLSRFDSLTSDLLMKQASCTAYSYLSTCTGTWQTERGGNERHTRMSENSKESWQGCKWVAETSWRNERVNAEKTKREKSVILLKDADLHSRTHTSTPCPKLPFLANITNGQNMALSKKSLCSCKLLSTNRQLQAMVAMAICFFQAMLLSTMFNNVNNAKGKTKQ